MLPILTGRLTINPVFTVESIEYGFSPKVVVSWGHNGKKERAVLGQGDTLIMHLNAEIPAPNNSPTVEDALKVIKEALK